MKLIVYHSAGKVTGVERVEPTMLKAMRVGLFGADAVVFKRASQVLGVETIDTLMKTTPQASEQEALANHARGTHPAKSWLLVEESALPEGEQETWVVDGASLKAAA